MQQLILIQLVCFVPYWIVSMWSPNRMHFHIASLALGACGFFAAATRVQRGEVLFWLPLLYCLWYITRALRNIAPEEFGKIKYIRSLWNAFRHDPRLKTWR